MSATRGQLDTQLTETPDRLRAEFSHGTATEIGELYRALAVACIQKQVTRVLIIAGDDDPAGERALRDALTMMVLAGIADGFRLALVTPLPRVEYVYRNAQRDFTAAGITTRQFDNEDEALQWLDQGRGQAGSRSMGMPQHADPQGPQ